MAGDPHTVHRLDFYEVRPPLGCSVPLLFVYRSTREIYKACHICFIRLQITRCEGNAHPVQRILFPQTPRSLLPCPKTTGSLDRFEYAADHGPEVTIHHITGRTRVGQAASSRRFRGRYGRRRHWRRRWRYWHPRWLPVSMSGHGHDHGGATRILPKLDVDCYCHGFKLHNTTESTKNSAVERSVPIELVVLQPGLEFAHRLDGPFGADLNTCTVTFSIVAD